MKTILTHLNQDELVQKLGIIIHEESNYALIENGLDGVDDLINIYFNPQKLLETKELLKESGYYSSLQLDHLIGKKAEDVHLVPLRDILYIEGVNNDTYIYTAEGSYTIKEKLYELETSLYRQKFIRISKSFMVSIQKISKIKPTFNGKLVLLLENNIKLEVSRHYIRSFKKYLGM